MERGRRALLGLAAGAALLLSAGRASAEDGAGRHVQFRFAFGGGLFSAPGYVTFGAFNANFQSGVHFNDLLALSLDLNMDLVSSRPTWLCYGAGLLVEFTFGGRFAVGIGPHAGMYGEPATVPQPVIVHADGGLYGGKLRFAWHPFDKSFDKFVHGLALGLDVRLLRGHTPLLVPMAKTAVTVPASTVLLPFLSVGVETL